MKVIGLSKCALLAGLMATTAASAATVVVSPSSMNGWAFYTSDSSGVFGTGNATAELVNGPTTPPLGTGSAHLASVPGPGNGAGQMRNSNWSGTLVSAITTLGYSTFATQWNGAQDTYLQLYIDTDNDGVYNDRLYFEPTYSRAAASNGNPSPQADPALNVWQSWDALGGMWYSDGHIAGSGAGSNAKTWSAILAALPAGTKIVNDINNQGGVGGLRVTAGFAGAGEQFNTYVDALTIGTATGSTTYNFELADAGAAVPLPAASVAGLSLSGLLALRRSRRS